MNRVLNFLNFMNGTKRTGVLFSILIAAAAAFLIANLGDAVRARRPGSRDFRITEVPPHEQSQVQEREAAEIYRPAIDYEKAVVSAVEKASPAVVSIAITKELPIIERCPYDPFDGFNDPFGDFFGPSPFQFYRQCQKGTEKREVGGGTGFIVSSDGLVITNKHVVADEEAEYTVLTNDGRKHSAEVLARDPVQDIAVMKIKGSSFPEVLLGDSDSVKLGQTAIAIGNALGEFRNTVSAGVVSGLARNIVAVSGSETEQLEDLIQIDAAINRGNSGGPLLNLRGEVIGINTAMAQGAQNIGFAIPINKVRRDIASVERGGKITAPFLGVRYIPVTLELKEKENLSVDYGALLRGNEDGPAVIVGSPADRAGLFAEDIILELDGEKVTPEKSLASLIQEYNVGDAVRLLIFRKGQRIDVSAVLTERTE